MIWPKGTCPGFAGEGDRGPDVGHGEPTGDGRPGWEIPPVDGDPAGEGVGGAAHREHAVGNPAVEDQELVVAKGAPE